MTFARRSAESWFILSIVPDRLSVVDVNNASTGDVILALLMTSDHDASIGV
jgi:hypothetical protein